MFGMNPIRKIDLSPADGLLAVQEIFYTLQGEGPYSGLPAVFIRLAGCHLACTWCDTEFESNINQRMSPLSIVSEVDRLLSARSEYLPLIVLTGGEPLRQNLVPLINRLRDAEYQKVQIETAGNLWGVGLSAFVESGMLELVCSPKTAHVSPEIIKRCKHWKYVVRAGETGGDGLPSVGTQLNNKAPPWSVRTGPGHDNYSRITIWISPCDDHDAEQNAANVKHAVEICLKHGYRLSLQTHKLVNLP